MLQGFAAHGLLAVLNQGLQSPEFVTWAAQRYAIGVRR